MVWCGDMRAPLADDDRIISQFQYVLGSAVPTTVANVVGQLLAYGEAKGMPMMNPPHLQGKVGCHDAV